MRVAVVGCGGIGKLHAAAYRSLGAEVAYMVDVIPEVAKAAASAFGARAATSLEELEGPLDAVSVATPPAAHREPILRLLDRGIPVFSEKPLTMDVAEAEEIAARSDALGIPVGLGFKMRFEPVFCRARELVGQLGEIYAVSAVKCQPFSPRPSSWVPGVGCMYELGVHEYDLIRWIAGLRAESVSATLVHAMGWPREDRAYLDVQYSGNVRGQLMCHYLPDTAFSFCDLAITYVGQRGYIRVERPGRIFLHTDRDEIFDVTPEDNGALFTLQLDAFLQAAKDGRRCTPNARDGLEITAFVEAARRSAETGERVML